MRVANVPPLEPPELGSPEAGRHRDEVDDAAVRRARGEQSSRLVMGQRASGGARGSTAASRVGDLDTQVRRHDPAILLGGLLRATVARDPCRDGLRVEGRDGGFHLRDPLLYSCTPRRVATQGAEAGDVIRDARQHAFRRLDTRSASGGLPLQVGSLRASRVAIHVARHDDSTFRAGVAEGDVV